MDDVILYIKGEINKNFKIIKDKKWTICSFSSNVFGGPVGMAAYLLAINYIGPGYTASISAIYPAVGAFFAYIFLKENYLVEDG